MGDVEVTQGPTLLSVWEHTVTHPSPRDAERSDAIIKNLTSSFCVRALTSFKPPLSSSSCVPHLGKLTGKLGALPWALLGE